MFRRVTRAVYTALFSLVIATACNRGERALPPELLGTWVTNSPAYAGRTFTFEVPDKVNFRSGEGDQWVSSRRIRAIEAKWDASKQATLYKIAYKEAGEELIFPFYLSTQPTLVIRFKNQPDISWKPASSGS